MSRYPLVSDGEQEWAVFTFFDRQVRCHPDVAARVERALLREAMAEIVAREAAYERDLSVDWNC